MCRKRLLVAVYEGGGKTNREHNKALWRNNVLYFNEKPA
jgi:hypothetical protein